MPCVCMRYGVWLIQGPCPPLSPPSLLLSRGRSFGSRPVHDTDMKRAALKMTQSASAPRCRPQAGTAQRTRPLHVRPC